MDIDEIQTDPEFERLFADTRLSGADREHLRNKLVTEGFHDPLVLWNGVLLDGYTRLAICREEGIEPAVRSVELPDREAAVEWIRIHQHSRRNLDAKARALNIAEVYEGRKKRSGERSDLTSDSDYQRSTTRYEVAAEFQVSPSAVQRAVEYKRGLDAIEEQQGSEARAEAERLPMDTIIERNRPGRQKPVEPQHRAALDKVETIGTALEPSERKLFSRGLVALARKWGTSVK